MFYLIHCIETQDGLKYAIQEEYRTQDLADEAAGNAPSLGPGHHWEVFDQTDYDIVFLQGGQIPTGVLH